MYNIVLIGTYTIRYAYTFRFHDYKAFRTERTESRYDYKDTSVFNILKNNRDST